LAALPNAKQEQNTGPITVKSLTLQIKVLARLLQTIADADVRSALWGALKDFNADYGYDRLTIFQNSPHKEIAAAEVLFSDATPETLDQFQRSAWEHPLIVEAMRAREPFTRADVKLEAGAGAPELAEKDLYPGQNLIVPVPDGDHTKGVAVLAGEHSDTSAIAKSLIQVAVETAFDRAQTLPSVEGVAGGGLLSPREAAILGWAASGKTDAEIGGLLKISARTVRFHTDNAKRKLRVSTRIQAVTEALRLGLIKL
jgi:DNA-binding CsgD family transcriptional regulator